MLRRRELLIGAGLAALSACVGRVGGERSGAAVPAGRWAPYAGAMAIDGASALDLLFAFDDPAEFAKVVQGDLAAARQSGLTAVVATVAPQGRFWLDDEAFLKNQQDIATWKAKIAAHAEHLMLIERHADLEAAHASGRLGIVMTFQGTEPLGEDPDRIAMFRELGVRVMQLTHNRRNLVGDGAIEPGDAGLSKLGHEVIERLEAERIIVDVAHGSRRTMHEGIAAAKRPLLISHTGCRALSDLPRCTPDRELRMLADKGGVAGMIFWPYLRTDRQPLAIDLIRHIEHAVNICGEDHVGLGSDTGVAPIDTGGGFQASNRAMIADMVQQGIFEHGRPADLYTFLPDLNVANRYERIAAMLAARGHSDARIAKIIGGNFARVMREIWI
ncbi:MAG TPA: membrane dipeptidase [Kofleriaceae bacterium]